MLNKQVLNIFVVIELIKIIIIIIIIIKLIVWLRNRQNHHICALSC